MDTTSKQKLNEFLTDATIFETFYYNFDATMTILSDSNVIIFGQLYKKHGVSIKKSYKFS